MELMTESTGDHPREPRLGLNRRQLLWASAAAVASVGLGSGSAAVAAPLAIATQAEHTALPVSWGYPLSTRALRRSGVDGYPGATYAGHNGVD